MNHNDRLTRMRYALDIKDDQMKTIFELGGKSVTKEEVRKWMTKNPDTESGYETTLDSESFERFLNGLIASQRGPAESEPDLILNEGNANNQLLKKVKIAFQLQSEDLLEMMEEGGLTISKSELSAVLRREGHRNYKTCGDKYIRHFLKGLANQYR